MKKQNGISSISKLIQLGLVSIITSGTLYAGSYNVDPVHSNVGFKVKHMMISNVKGEFNKFGGSFEYDEKTNTLKTFNGRIEVSSINTDNAKRDGHLKSEELFNAAKFPSIEFKLDKISGDKAFGSLTMKGVTKEVTLNFEDNGTVKDPWGNTRVGLALSGEINRKDYGISWNQVLEAGGVAVGETVKLDIEVEGILAK